MIDEFILSWICSCIATVSGDVFIPYYAGFMPGIISLLREATSPDLATLRGKAMECAGLVGEAVGVQVFAADALQIMQLFMNALVSFSDPLLFSCVPR